LAEAAILHLDNSHYDALLALKDGHAIALAGVLAMGEIGRIDQVYVSKAFRKQSIATMMMNRIMEVCARSLFKHVLLAVEGDNVAAIKLFEKFGFKKIARIETYVRP
jgi:ribosomal-protein-alanine N-acetyltransferase